MYRSLIKRELKESFAWMYRNKRTGKPYPLWKTFLLALLYALAFAWLMHTFYKMGSALCVPLMALDLECFTKMLAKIKSSI